MSDREIKPDSNASSARPGSRLRLLVRCTSLWVAIICLSMVLTGDSLVRYVPALSPFAALSSLLATRSLQPIMGLGLIVGLMAVLRRRWFCRWVCPTGLCGDGASYLGRRLKRKPSQGAKIGHWLAILTLGGAAAGYPLFLWLDPLAIFSGIFLPLERPAALISWISALLFLSLLILSLLRPNLWCARLCPLGACQDLLSAVSRSGRSLLRDKAKTRSLANAEFLTTRRAVMGLILGAGCAQASRRVASKPVRVLRPPGAVDERSFSGLCTRCGNCIRACPHGVIERDTGKQGWAGILAPVLTFENDYCREDCTRCTEVCPSGALAQVRPEQKPSVRIGLPSVDMDICLLSEDRECSACMRWCPYEAIRYVFSETSYSLAPVIDTEKCNGCGACEKACPTRPVKAIRVTAAASS